MKSRSHRLPVSEPRHDDWVDGSWTVDCVCGVNFDDGEEMVDCDECGVWVHTRCSRYVKSEKSFSCDKCKNKNTGGGSSARNDSEETEVAEFLVELPTKTLRMDTPNPLSVSSSRRPFRLWTDIPKEERAHVQGVPGGDPGLFPGTEMSSAFGPGLWKCSGYVPKKFNFKYSDFPCLSRVCAEENREKEMDRTNCGEDASRADHVAGALFSLLKGNGRNLPTPVVDSIGVKSAVEGGGCRDVVASPRRKKKLGAENMGLVGPVDTVKKESGSVTIVLHSGKRRKDDLGMSKDQKRKKKMKTIEEEGVPKKGTAHDSKAASKLSSDAKHLEVSEVRGSKAVSNDIESGKDVLRDQLSHGLGECATNLALTESGRNDVLSGEMSRGGSGGNQDHVGSENFAKTSNGVESLTELNGSRRTPIKEEVLGDTPQSCRDVGRDTGSAEMGSHNKERTVVELRIAGPDAKESRHGHSSDIDEDNSRPNKKLKSEIDAHDNGQHHVESFPLNDVKLDMKANTHYPELAVTHHSEDGKVFETSNLSSEASDQKGLDASRRLTVGSSRSDKFDEPPDNPSQSKREPSGSEGSMGGRRRSSGLKHSSQAADELPKSNGTPRSHSTAYQRKAVVSVEKIASTTGSNMSKSSDKRMDASAPNPSINSRPKELPESSVGTTKKNASVDTVELEEKCGRPKKFVKDHPKQNHLAKISESTKLVHTSNRPSSESKDSSTHSKIPLVPNVESNCSLGECASPPLVEGTSSAQNKAAASAAPGKGEKVCHSGSHPSSRGHVASMNAPAPSNVPATMSDEELALLLHQELNSSPRVPRVPRMRHAGSLPQLNGPSTTSTLMKRTSSCGGKDHSVASRRRNKDLSGEASHGSLDVVNEATKMERKPSSPDNRKRDSGYSADLLSRRETDGAVKSVHLMKKSDANGHDLLSSRPSSRKISDDDPRMVGRLTKRTLPGLIAEIMSEGKRMTYEELCNAVLPHWPHLRKHNGERYAYSSHSQAVLDCLRNRSEWARLVDRGPKTSASRKRRRLDADSVSVDSEDNEDNRVKNAKDSGSKSFESHQEDFPKGKRKARKGRRLALQGKGIIRRRRRRADVVSDDESESFSTSSEEDSMSSEEEIQNGGTSIVGSEASASSDEAR